MPPEHGVPVSFSLHAKKFDGLGRQTLTQTLRPTDLECSRNDLDNIFSGELIGTHNWSTFHSVRLALRNALDEVIV